MKTFEAIYQKEQGNGWRDGSTKSFEIQAKNLLDAFLRADKAVQVQYPGHSVTAIRDSFGDIVHDDRLEEYLSCQKRFVLLSGPSCAGKTPLRKAAQPCVEFQRPVLYTSRDRRSDETDNLDFRFRSPEFIRALADPANNGRYIVGDVREMVQAIDLHDLDFSRSNLVFVEAYHTLGAQLQASNAIPEDVIPVSVFLSPFSAEELAKMKAKGTASLEEAVYATMFEKLKHRCLVQGAPYERLSKQEQDKIRGRASDAITELRNAYKYDFVIINHDGEGHMNWEGRMNDDAFRAADAFVRILKYGIHRPHMVIQECPGKRLRLHPTMPSPYAAAVIEHWDENTV